MAYSARFLALLESGAAVLKSTIYSEFYSDQIQRKSPLPAPFFGDALNALLFEFSVVSLHPRLPSIFRDLQYL